MSRDFQEMTVEKLQTTEGVFVLNDMLRSLFYSGRRQIIQYSLSASTSADAYAKLGEVQTSATIGLRMASKGSITNHSCLMNVTTATSGDVTSEVRINDTNQSSIELEFNSSAGTGVASNHIHAARHAVTFDDGDLVQIFLNETGTMVWENVVGFIEVVFDDDD